MPLSLKDLKVFVATPCMGTFPVQTLCSYIDTQEECLKAGIDVEFGFASCSLVHQARTLLGWTFLQKDRNRLFWIDSDMQWKAETFIKVLEHSLKHECVVGVYPRRSDPPGYFVRFTDPKKDPDADGLVEIDATGLGFACINRGVMVHLANLAPKLRYPFSTERVPQLFRCDDNGDEDRGEDYAFWSDVKDAGYKIYADCNADLGHVGTKVYRCAAFGK